MSDIPALSIRLQAVYDIATAASDAKGRFIDVGSDHGYLSLYALNENRYKYCIATDIHEDPASKTRRILAAYGFEDRSAAYCTDGLDGIPLEINDTIVMAGLGGNNMMDILTRAAASTTEDVLSSVTWCFQPQKTIEPLRQFLYEHGYSILDEDVCYDRGIYYPIIIARFDGKVKRLNLIEKYYGPVLVSKFREKQGPVMTYFEYLNGRFNVRARGDEEIKEVVEMVKRGAL